MDFKKNEFKNYLLKFENIEIIYKSPKQHWGITDKGLKKRISISVFNEFLKIKKLISYEDSKKIKKGINFKILQNKIEIFSKKKKISINVISNKNYSDLDFSTKRLECKKDNINIKKELGQFFSSNCDYIFTNISIPKSVNWIIEPFGGNGELLKWIYKKTNINAESYDIMPKFNGIKKRDVFTDIPVYKDKFVITNPPYLSKNKSKKKSIFNLYKTDDLYKCFMLQLINDPCIGGILILPLNFFCSFRKKDLNLRKRFLDLYEIILINIFEEPVFFDTSYTVCSFMFKKKINFLQIATKIYIYPSNFFFSVIFNNKNDYSFSGNILNLSKTTVFSIKRLTKLNYTSTYSTNILVQCIDNKNKKINALVVSNELVHVDNTQNASARSYLSLWIKPKISLELQKKLVILFNNFLSKKRKEFYSLFLSQYRELNRKRISFNLVYNIFSYLLKTFI